MKNRYLLTVQYDGRGYSGWQRQRNGAGIQELLEIALSKVFGTDIALHGSGRTDAGVSAYCQTAHFDAETTIPADRIPYVLNVLLPNDISVLECRIVDLEFHSRFHKKKKTYVYKVYSAPVKKPLLSRDRFWIRKPLDFDKMKETAAVMTGTYDCKCFQKEGSPSGDTTKTIYSVEVLKLDDGVYDIFMTGSGFLYKMARTMAGTILYAGLGKLDALDVSQAIKKCDKTKIGKTLAAEYLYLAAIEYID